MPEHDGYALEGAAAFAATAVEITHRAEHEIALLSHQLPNEPYGRPAFLTQIRCMILGAAGRHTRMRILVQDPCDLGSRNRLVALGQELSSFLAFRQSATGHADPCREWLIIDRQHVLQRQTPESVAATCYLNVPSKARAALRRFDEAWNLAQPITGLHRLSL